MDEVTAYIASQKEPTRTHLQDLRQALQSVLPNAQEGLRWSKAAFFTDTILVIYAGYKAHVSLHVTPSTLEAFESKLANYQHGGTTVQFPNDKPLPTALIKEMARYRLEEYAERSIPWIS